jgi:hypothetical protein
MVMGDPTSERKTAEMIFGIVAAQRQTYRAAIPATYTQSPFALQYYFDLAQEGSAGLYPGFNEGFASQRGRFNSPRRLGARIFEELRHLDRRILPAHVAGQQFSGVLRNRGKHLGIERAHGAEPLGRRSIVVRNPASIRHRHVRRNQPYLHLLRGGSGETEGHPIVGL